MLREREGALTSLQKMYSERWSKRRPLLLDVIHLRRVRKPTKESCSNTVYYGAGSAAANQGCRRGKEITAPAANNGKLQQAVDKPCRGWIDRKIGEANSVGPCAVMKMPIIQTGYPLTSHVEDG